MANEKYIILAEATIQPQYRDEVIAAARAALPLTLAEEGTVAFFQTVRSDEPNSIVFLEIFASKEAHEQHMRQDYAKKVFETMEGKLIGSPRFTQLTEL